MSFTDEKLGVLNEIEILKASYDTPNQPKKNPTNMDSINDKKVKIAMFMFDLVILLVGTESLKEIVGRIIKKVLVEAENSIKKALFQKAQIPTGEKEIPQFLKDGYKVDLVKLDKKKQFNIAPTSPEGQNLYSKDATSLDRTIYTAIDTNAPATYKNNLDVTFDNTTQKVTFKPNTNAIQTVNAFINKYLMGLDILDEDAITKYILDLLFGGQKPKTDKEKDEDTIIKAMVDTIINTDDVTNLVLEEVNPISVLSSNVIDLGCGYFEMSITNEEYSQALSGITSSQSNEAIGNVFDTLLNKNVTPVNGDVKKDSEAKIGFFKKIIDGILKATIGNVVKSPDLSLYLNLLNNFKDETNKEFKDTKELLKENVDIVKTMANSIECLINEELYNIVVKEITKIAKKQVRKLVREKLEVLFKVQKGNIGI